MFKIGLSASLKQQDDRTGRRPKKPMSGRRYMKTEFLKELKMEQDVIDKILAENGRDIEAAKAKYADYDDVKKQLKEANKQISSFKEMDIDGIKKAADDWKEKAEKAESEADKKIEALQFDHALDGALSGAKAKNAKAVKALLNMDGLKYNNGEVIGLNEQLEKIKSENDYLFDSGEKPPRVVTKTQGATETIDTKREQANAALRSLFGKE